jgi:hypothetical protein
MHTGRYKRSVVVSADMSGCQIGRSRPMERAEFAAAQRTVLLSTDAHRFLLFQSLLPSMSRDSPASDFDVCLLLRHTAAKQLSWSITNPNSLLLSKTHV